MADLFYFSERFYPGRQSRAVYDPEDCYLFVFDPINDQPGIAHCFFFAAHLDLASFKLIEGAFSALAIQASKAGKSISLPGRAGDSKRGVFTIRIYFFPSRSCRVFRALLFVICTVTVRIKID
jgi:hypothetical protein